MKPFHLDLNRVNKIHMQEIRRIRIITKYFKYIRSLNETYRRRWHVFDYQPY
jgi:hypothetical protein